MARAGVRARLAGLTLSLVPVVSVAADTAAPRLEWGAGLAVFSTPDYRGSDVVRDYALPLPYLRYRGDWIRLDREGLRAMLFDDERLEIDLSVDANPALRNEDNPARRGMPELKPTFEAGPEIAWRAWGVEDGTRLDLRLALRAALTLGDGGLAHRGWTLAPNLRWTLADVAGSGAEMRVTFGPLFGDGRYHEYVYGVAPAQATPSRPAYDARGGYAGTTLVVSMTRRIHRVWVGGFVRADTLRGARFEDSPLVRRSSYVVAGVALSWIFGSASW